MRAEDAPGPEPHPPAWMRRLAERAPGVEPGHFQLAPRLQQPPGGGRASAVLMLFGPHGGGDTDVLLTERSTGLRSHAGQVSFPGGRIDPRDGGPVQAAVREANEEVGLDPAGVVPLAELPRIDLSVSSSVVTPVLAWWPRPGPVWVRSPQEVAAVHRVSVEDLLDPANRFSVRHRASGHLGPAFEVRGLLVWGFTAGLLAKVLELAGLERPWDRDRIRAAPVPLAHTREAQVIAAHTQAAPTADAQTGTCEVLPPSVRPAAAETPTSDTATSTTTGQGGERA